MDILARKDLLYDDRSIFLSYIFFEISYIHHKDQNPPMESSGMFHLVRSEPCFEWPKLALMMSR
ncbi:hypothetical protein V6Z11_A03G188200 [Gossypium hirsutum]